MYCPVCGTKVQSNFCPNCGEDLRNRSVPKAGGAYADYLRFYPDKLAAIRALRIDTGMSLFEANSIVERLFGHEPPDHVAEVDVDDYARTYYPNKAAAIHALQRQEISEADATAAIEEAFRRIRQEKEEERRVKAGKAAKTVGKGVGLTALFLGWGALRIISGLVKPYTKRRRR